MELFGVEPAVTHRGPVEQQHGHLVAEAGLESWIGVDIHDQYAERLSKAEGLELLEHLVAELAART
jgi:hypothetical protein